jgi:hypothetical protein
MSFLSSQGSRTQVVPVFEVVGETLLEGVVVAGSLGRHDHVRALEDVEADLALRVVDLVRQHSHLVPDLFLLSSVLRALLGRALDELLAQLLQLGLDLL